MVAAAAAAAAALHRRPLLRPALRLSFALRERGSGVQRPRVPDGDQGAPEPRELHGPASGGEPHHGSGQQHKPAGSAHPHLRHPVHQPRPWRGVRGQHRFRGRGADPGLHLHPDGRSHRGHQWGVCCGPALQGESDRCSTQSSQSSNSEILLKLI